MRSIPSSTRLLIGFDANLRTTEAVWLANGDRLTGGFLGMDENKITLQAGGKSVDVDRGGVVALGFDPGARGLSAAEVRFS